MTGSMDYEAVIRMMKGSNLNRTDKEYYDEDRQQPSGLQHAVEALHGTTSEFRSRHRLYPLLHFLDYGPEVSLHHFDQVFDLDQR